MTANNEQSETFPASVSSVYEHNPKVAHPLLKEPITLTREVVDFDDPSLVLQADERSIGGASHVYVLRDTRVYPQGDEREKWDGELQVIKFRDRSRSRSRH